MYLKTAVSFVVLSCACCADRQADDRIERDKNNFLIADFFCWEILFGRASLLTEMEKRLTQGAKMDREVIFTDELAQLAAGVKSVQQENRLVKD
jgi:hypothetical protein